MSQRRILIILALTLLSSAPLFAQRGRGRRKSPAEYDVAEVYERVEDERDEVRGFWLYVLAVRGPEDHFEIFRKAVRLLRNDRKVRRGYGYLEFLEDATERAQAVEFLGVEALGAPRSVHRIGATRAAVGFGGEAHVLLERIAAEGKDAEARRVAIGPLLPRIAAERTLEALEKILSAADPGEPSQRQPLQRALAQFTSPEARALLIERLGHHQTSLEWRAALLERLAGEEGGEVTEAIVDLLRRRDPRLVEQTLEVLRARGELELVQREVRKLLDSPDEHLRYVAISSGALALFTDERWRAKLIALAAHRDPVRRLGATHAMVELRTPEAIEALYALIEDSDWRVQVAAIRGAATLRRLDSLPVLMEALEREEGRVRWEVVSALKHITGLDLGPTPERWNRWWETEGVGYVVPPLEDLESQRAARVAPDAEARSAATFYGLPVLSKRIAFVLDVSGSMKGPAVVEGRSQAANGRKGPRRIDVAKEQLQGMLKALTPDTFCNVVFFSSDVVAWQDEVVSMTDANRKDARRFIQEQRSFGGTNLYDAIEFALADELVDTIYVLSDGAPTVGSVLGTEPIRSGLARTNSLRNVQVHCISVGRGSKLLELIARDAGGEYLELGKPPDSEDE